MLRALLLMGVLLWPAVTLGQDGGDVPLTVAAPDGPVTSPVAAPPMPVTVTLPPLPPVPVDPLADDPTGLVRLFTRAVKERNYTLAAAFGLMFVTWVLRKRYTALNPKLVPLATLTMGSVPTLVVLLKNPAVQVDEVLSTLVVIWLMSAGAWENAAKQARDLVPWGTLRARVDAVRSAVFRKPPAPPPAPPEPPKP